jgi:hypothetical protein
MFIMGSQVIGPIELPDFEYMIPIAFFDPGYFFQYQVHVGLRPGGKD